MAQYNKRVSQPLREFSKGEKAFLKPRPANKHQFWIYGKVIGSTAPRSYIVNTSMGPVQRNHTQIREAKVEPEKKYERADDHLEIVFFPESEPTHRDQPVEPSPEREQGPISTLHCSMRQQRPPPRFRDFVMEQKLLCYQNQIVLSLTFIFQKRKGVAPCNYHLPTYTA